MNHKYSAGIVAPLVFAICLWFVPGFAGFFLALVVLLLLSLALIQYEHPDDSKPLPDNRILKLPYRPISLQDKAEMETPAGSDHYEKAFQNVSDPKLDAATQISQRAQALQHSIADPAPPPKKPEAGPSPGGTIDETDPRRDAMQAFLFYALGFGFLFLVASSEGLFEALSYLFITVIIIALLAIVAFIILALGGRRGLYIGGAVIATLLTVCLFVLQRPSVYLALECSLAWLSACLLVRFLTKREKKTCGFLYILAKNGTQFAIVFLGAAAIAALLPFIFRHVPLSTVLTWREYLEALRTHLEQIKLTSFASLGVVLAFFFARRGLPHWQSEGKCEPVAKVWNSASDWLKRHSVVGSRLESLWKIWDRGSGWVKNVAFALTALFCFSFVGSLHGNAIETLETRIEEFDKIYDQLVWNVYLDLSAKLNIEAYAAAWEQLPQGAKELVQRELSINKTAAGIPQIYFSTTVPYDLMSSTRFDKNVIHAQIESADSLKSTWLPALPGDMPESFPKVDVPSEATFPAVVIASSNAEHLEADHNHPAWMDGIGGKAMDKFLEFILDTDHLEFISQLSKHYPVTSELLDIVSKSVQEKISGRLEEAAERISRKQMQDPSLSLPYLIGQEVASLGIVPDVSQAVARMKSREPALQAREAEVDAANRRFHDDLRQEMAKETLQMRAQKEQLEMAEHILGKAPANEAEKREDMTVSLDSLEKIQERTDSYRDQLRDVVQSSPSSKHMELIRFLGETKFKDMMRVPSYAEVDSGETVPSVKPGSSFHPPSEELTPPHDVGHPDESVPHPEGPI